MRLTTAETKADIFLFPRLQLIAANLELQGLLQDLLQVALDNEVEAEVEVPEEEAVMSEENTIPNEKAPTETKSETSSDLLNVPSSEPSIMENKSATIQGKIKTAVQMESASKAEATDALANVIVKLANLSKQIVRVVDGASEITSTLGLEDDEEFSNKMLKILISGLSSKGNNTAVKNFLNLKDAPNSVPSDLYIVIDDVIKQYFEKSDHKKEITGPIRQILQNGSARAPSARALHQHWFLVKLQSELRKVIKWTPSTTPTEVAPEKKPEVLEGNI